MNKVTHDRTSYTHKKSFFIILMLILLLSGCKHKIVELTGTHSAVFSDHPSSDKIFAMQKDGNGYLWIGTDRGVDIFDGTNYRNITHDKNDTTTLRSQNVINIYKDLQDSMWVMTDKGLDKFVGNGTVRHYNSNASVKTATCMLEMHDGKFVALFGSQICFLKDGQFVKSCKLNGEYSTVDRTLMIESGDGRLLVCTNSGVFIISKDLRHVKQLPITGSVIACADKNTVCLLSFDDGIFVLNRKNLKIAYKTGKGMPVVAENAVIWKGKLLFAGYEGIFTMGLTDHKISPLSQYLQDNLHPRFIQKLYVDSDGILWIGYNRRYKIQKISSIEEVERKVQEDYNFEIFSRHGVVGVTQDNYGNIFGALDNDSVFYINKATNTLSAKSLDSFIPIHSKQHVQSVCFSAGYFWVVTTSNVLAIKYEGDFRMAEFYDVGLAARGMCGTSMPVKNGIALVSNGKLLMFDAIHRSKNVDDTRLAANSKPVIWQIGNFGVKVTNIDYGKISQGSSLLNTGNDKVMAAYQIGLHDNIICSVTHGNHAFIGTDNGLYIYDCNSGKLTKMSEFGDEPINNIAIANDVIVLTCEGGIFSFDPATRHIRTIWQGSPQKDFQPNTLAIMSQNTLFAATVDGFHKFNVRQKAKSDVYPKLFIESVDAVLNNNDIRSRSLFDADSTTIVILNHKENTISIKYAAITPSMSGKYTFRYRLKGYNDNWEYSDNSGDVEYAKVRPGKYHFEITCVDQQRPWITVSKSLTIYLQPHPMLSWFAISFYVFIVLIAIFFANRLYIRMKMVRMNHDNAAFFYNISHEFRNPITMIAGPVSVLRKAPELSKQSANMVRLISQSAKMLIKLANQMLDFNLLDGDALRLSVNRVDVAAIISEYSHHYEVSAAEKGIHIINIRTEIPIVILADDDKIIKIFDNIMSNAVKHTPQGGTITVTLAITTYRLILSVENTGSRIPKSWDTGVSLHYVKTLVNLHHGSISATNTDKGVLFTVSLPMEDKEYSEEERKPRVQKQVDTTAFTDDDILRPRQMQDASFVDIRFSKGGAVTANGEKRPTLLFIEKDVNTAYFLRKIFESDYKVVNRYSAEAVHNDLAEINPDIIVSCVMLNGESGFDLCRELHANELYKDIPFIFLTTCNSGDQQVEGMKAGADAYITKPFDPEYLREVIVKELKHAEEYKKMLAQLPQQKEPQQDGLSTRDKEILRVIRKFMKDNINDGELNIEKLCRKLLLSRSKFYEKVKVLTGKTPNELFRTYKLSYAAKLLKEGKLNVSEVAEKAGFSSMPYFSRTFKKYYGVSPKDYD